MELTSRCLNLEVAPSFVENWWTRGGGDGGGSDSNILFILLSSLYQGFTLWYFIFLVFLSPLFMIYCFQLNFRSSLPSAHVFLFLFHINLV